MPEEAMATEPDVVLTAEIGHAVSLFPVPYTFLRMQLTGLHHILSRETVVVGEDEIDLFRMADVTGIDSYANGKVVLVGILQTLRKEIGGKAAYAG
jgi:hypothetical protein